jgi:deoxyribonuclease-4
MRIGAHVREDDPLEAARRCQAEVVQVFLGDPQGWKKPERPAFAEELQASELTVFVHSPYVINVASPNNRIRIPSRKAVLQQTEMAAEVGASGVIVHGGHVRKEDDPAEGFANWRKLFERQQKEGGFRTPVLIENTAGGDHAMARTLEAIARLWDAVGEFGSGFCLDTCHAFAAGHPLPDVVDKVLAITGRIDLVHLNSSRDAFGSGRDRHTNIASGTIDGEELAAVVRAAGAPVVVETPSQGQASDIAFLRRSVPA